MEDFFEEFSLSETQFLASKTQLAVLKIKELLAAAAVMKPTNPAASRRLGAKLNQKSCARYKKFQRKEELASASSIFVHKNREFVDKIPTKCDSTASSTNSLSRLPNFSQACFEERVDDWREVASN